MKTTANQKHFLKKSFSLIAVVLAVLLLSLSGIYLFLLQALQKEVETLNMNTATELQLRTEQVLEECNTLASKLILDEASRLFFTNSNPDSLIADYSTKLANQLNQLERNYIDSIVFYAPKFRHLLFSDFPNNGRIQLHLADDNPVYYDLEWMEQIPELDGLVENVIYPRAKKGNWPYVLTLIKHYQHKSVDAVVAINIDLEELYEYLIYGKNNNTKLFLIDENDNIFLSEHQIALLEPIRSVSALSHFRKNENFGVLNTDSSAYYAYMQIFSPQYNITYATVTDLSDYVRQLSSIRSKFILLICSSSVVAIFICVFFSMRMRRPLLEIRQLLNDGSYLDRPDEYTGEIQDIADQIVSHIQTNAMLRDELDEKLHMLNDSQLFALQTQINPHFLFNTLNIISLITEADHGDDYAAVVMLNELSLLLRYALSEDFTVQIEEEVHYTEKYLNIARYRYEDFSVSITIDDNIKHCAIPKLVLQPLVENALQHGLALCMTQKQATLSLRISGAPYIYHDNQERFSIILELEDNGVGMDKKTLRNLQESLKQYDVITKKHIGVQNVSRRFYLLFRHEHEFTIDSIPDNGTRIRIIFPATS